MIEKPAIKVAPARLAGVVAIKIAPTEIANKVLLKIVANIFSPNARWTSWSQATSGA